MPSQSNTNELMERLKLLPIIKRRVLHLIQNVKLLADTEQFLDERLTGMRSHAVGRRGLLLQHQHNNSYYGG